MNEREALDRVPSLHIQQETEWAELFSNFETRNRYLISAPSSELVLHAAEHDGGGLMSFLGRSMLQAMRPFEMTVVTAMGETVLRLKRPWRWMFAMLEVRDAQGTVLGRIQRRFHFFRRLYDVLDARGSRLAQIRGPLLKPWTFFIERDGLELGAIRKQWSGIGKEMFSTADNFGVELSSRMDSTLRRLVLGATFLIDFVHFEKQNNT